MKTNRRQLGFLWATVMGLFCLNTSPLRAQNNLADAEAATTTTNIDIGAGAVLQGFSKGRDDAAASKSSAALGLVKAQQEMDSATREAEAKLREAQNTRNAAGASALAQRQQDASIAASQQAAGGIGNVLSESLVQSIQQGAQAAGQAVGGAVAGHAGSMAGSGSGGGTASAGGGMSEAAGGAVAAGASAAAGQVFGGGEAAPPAATGGAPAASGTSVAAPAAPAAVGPAAGVASDVSAMRTSGKRYVGPPIRVAQPRPTFQGLFDAFCPKHRIKYGGEIGKVKGCPKCEQEKYMMWDAACPRHGKYGGQGPVTGCPRCREEMTAFAEDVKAPGPKTPAGRPGETIHTPPPIKYSR